MTFHRKAALAAAVLALTVGAGGALAQGPKAGPQAGAAKAAATYIGISLDDLRTQLKSGKSLAEVAVANNKDVAGLEAAIVADAKTHLDKAVADGKLTSDQAAQRLQKLKEHVDELVNHKGAPGGKKGGKDKGRQAARAAANVTATFTGLSLDQVRAQLQSGKSLAEIATAAGKPVDGLKAAIVADAKAKIAELVSSGKISAERGQTYLDDIQKNIDKIVNAKRPAK